MAYDTIYYNGTIHTMDECISIANWIATKNGRIEAIGINNPDVLQAKKLVDLNGKVLFPGFIDSHVHGTATGGRLKDFSVEEAKSVEDILKIVEEQCKAEDDFWIIGSGLNIRNLKEKRAPYKEELDKVSGDHPVYIKNVTLHGCLLNTKAFEMIELPSDLKGIVRKNNGDLTGELTSDDSVGYAASKINKLLSDQIVKEYIRTAVDYCITKGVTTLNTLDGGMFDDEDRDFYLWMDLLKELPIHIVQFYQTEDVERVKALKLPRIGGCLCLDGAAFVGTMASRKPYNDKMYPKGILYWSDERLYNFLKNANKEGLQTAIHAIGDAAVDQYLRVYEKVYYELGLENNPNHNRIEHFSLVWPEQIEKAVKMRLILSMQPIFTYMWDKKENNVYEELIGKENAEQMEPFADIVGMGGVIAGGSDGPVTMPSPLDGIHAAANLENEKKRLTVHEAIKLFTVNAAIASWEEDIKGSLEVGKLADFVVLDKDPYSHPKEINKISVLKTIVEDKLVYVKEESII